MVVVIIEKKMNREQYLNMRNKGEVNASLLHLFYVDKCKQMGLKEYPIEFFLKAAQAGGIISKLVQEAVEYYDTKFGIIEMSILKEGKRVPIKYI